MESKGIGWGRRFRKGGVPPDLLRFGNQFDRRGSQRGHVQRLADVAGGLRPAGVVMQERAARGEIQQRYAAEYGQGAPKTSLPETKPPHIHTLAA